jgi:sugar phosphate isomerase/epimerase
MNSAPFSGPALRSGLVSVSFRKLSVSEVVASAAAANLRGIEWGGDIHVPHGNLPAAKLAGRITRDAGLEVLAYGSYLRLGAPDSPLPEEVISTAIALGAPTIRVWAGQKSSAECQKTERDLINQSALALANLAAQAGLTICYEFHAHTLTDDAASAHRLFEDTRHPAIQTLWQPPNGQSDLECLASLEVALPILRNLHVFHWWPTPNERLPLASGRERWLKFLRRIHTANLTPDLLLEFIPNDDVQLLARESATLHEWIEEVWGSRAH